MKDFYDLFIRDLKHIYNVEEQIVKALPDLAKAATSEKLKEALRHHLKETKEQVKRLEEISKELNQDLAGYECEVTHDLLKEAHKITRANYDHFVKDAALISAMQRIEHFEIACYGALKAYAKHFKLKKVEELLEESSKEEGNADKKLIEIAEGTLFTSGINTEAHKRCA